MTRPKRLQSLRQLANEVERLCQRAGASRLLDELKLVAESEVRGHRRAGARICGKASVAAAVDYFVCKTVLEPVPPPKSWEAFCAIRRDYQLGQAARERCGDSYALELFALDERWRQLGADYSTDIAGS